jgi:hypothetical protein
VVSTLFSKSQRNILHASSGRMNLHHTDSGVTRNKEGVIYVGRLLGIYFGRSELWKTEKRTQPFLSLKETRQQKFSKK